MPWRRSNGEARSDGELANLEPVAEEKSLAFGEDYIQEETAGGWRDLENEASIEQDFEAEEGIEVTYMPPSPWTIKGIAGVIASSKLRVPKDSIYAEDVNLSLALNAKKRNKSRTTARAVKKHGKKSWSLRRLGRGHSQSSPEDSREDKDSFLVESSENSRKDEDSGPFESSEDSLPGDKDLGLLKSIEDSLEDKDSGLLDSGLLDLQLGSFDAQSFSDEIALLALGDLLAAEDITPTYEFPVDPVNDAKSSSQDEPLTPIGFIVRAFDGCDDATAHSSWDASTLDTNHYEL